MMRSYKTIYNFIWKQMVGFMLFPLLPRIRPFRYPSDKRCHGPQNWLRWGSKNKN